MKKTTYKIVLSAMFLAIGIVLPFFTGQIQTIGSMLLPMHLPVFLCGLLCGGGYGLLVGFILPILRSLLFTMPRLFPNAIAMAFELMTYGFIIASIYNDSNKRNIKTVFKSLIIAMIAGRIVWGIVEIILLGINGGAFTMEMFIAGALINSIPGIIAQLILIPTIMYALDRFGLFKFNK